MGIRGLTTFINNRAHLYLEDYQLYNTNAVLDGNSIASNLYKWHCKCNDCFGGDYDKFARVVVAFFDSLSQCNITPYVVLDGGYEKRKLATVISRMKNKMHTAASLSAVTEGSDSVFPLFLREVFVDVVLNLGVKVARCEFEGDLQIAAIAQALNCPVISYDSDYYILSCLYIPFSTVDICPKKAKVKSPSQPYRYLSCKIYHIENFLEAYGGLAKENLPLLSVLLGNDYIKGSLFAPFFRNLKIQKCSSSQSDQQKRIKSVIVWLQNETVESALKTILWRFKGVRRQLILRKIEAALKGYNEVDPFLLKHFGIESVGLYSPPQINLEDLDNSAKDDQCDEADTDDATSDLEGISSDEDLSDTSLNDKTNSQPAVNSFQDKYRQCLYPACFMDLVSLKKYYCVPQVEDNTAEDSHTISFRLIQIIYEILCPISVEPQGLSIAFRMGKGKIQCKILPRLVDIDIPSLDDINSFDKAFRQNLILTLLQIDSSHFSNLLNSVPLEWHLFLIALKYAVDKGNFDQAVIGSSLICFIVLNYVDPKLGFCRASKTFDKKFAQFLVNLKGKDVNSEFTSFHTLDQDNCVVFMDKVVSYFQMDSKLKINYRLYDKTLVHSFSQIQSVYLHVKYLNSLLGHPFPNLEIHTIFDGTFLYNMTSNLRKRSSIVEYLNVFLKECPSILAGVKQVFELVTCHFDKLNKCVTKKSRRKKKKVSSSGIDILDDNEQSLNSFEKENNDSTLIDPNNFYSILGVS